MLLPETFLYGVQLAVMLEALDGLHLAAVGLHGEDRAGLHRLAVEQHRARPAVRGVAADVRARQAEALPQEVDQEEARLDLSVARCSVHGERDLVRGHVTDLPRAGLPVSRP